MTSRALTLRTGVTVAAAALVATMLTSATVVGWHGPATVAIIAGPFAGIVTVLIATRGPDQRDRLGLRGVRARYLIGAVVIGASAWLWQIMVSIALTAPAPHRAFNGELPGPWVMGLDHAITALVTAMLFHGVLARSLATRWSGPAAIALSTLALAMFGSTPAGLPGAVFLGVVAGALALRTDSIAPGLALLIVIGLFRVLMTTHAFASPVWHLVFADRAALLATSITLTIAGLAIALWPERAPTADAREAATSPAPSGTFDLRGGLALAVWALAAHVLVGQAVVAWSGSPLAAGIAAQLATAVIIVGGARGIGVGARVGLELPEARYLAAAIVIGICKGEALGWTNAPVVAAFGPDAWKDRLNPVDLGVGIGVFAVLPAICEELLFRGVIARALATAWSHRKAIIVSALAFALSHHSPYQLFGPFTSGLIAGYITLRTDSIVPAMLTHFCHNAVVVLGAADQPAGLVDWLDAHPVLGPAIAATLTAAAIAVCALGPPRNARASPAPG